MAINFPNTPAIGDTINGFMWDGSAWVSVPSAVTTALPAGTIVGWGSSTAPANWLICDGSQVSRSTYASLFAAIGTTYGAGNGSTTFTLPDLRGRVPVGRDSTQTEFDVLGESGGAKTHTLTVAEMPTHNHRVLQGWNNGVSGYDTLGYWSGNQGNRGYQTNSGGSISATIEGAGGGGAHNNLQPYQVVNYIIKFSAGVTLGDSELASRVGSIENANATTNKAGLIPVIPQSASNAGGSVTVSSSGVITASGVTSLSIGGSFSALSRKYRILVTNLSFNSNTAADVMLRLRAGTTDHTANYHQGGPAQNGATTTTDNVTNATAFYAGIHGSTVGYASSSLELYSPGHATQTGYNFLFGGWTGAMRTKSGAGFLDTASAYDGFTIYGTNSVVLNATIQIFRYSE